MASSVVAFFGLFMALGGLFVIFVMLDRRRNWKRRKGNHQTGPEREYFRDLSDASTREADDDDLDASHHRQDQLLLPDELASDSQECLVLVISDSSLAFGICVFRNDREVEYFCEEIPEEDGSQAVGNSGRRASRCLMAALRAWSEKWYFAETINLLCQEEETVRLAHIFSKGSLLRKMSLHYYLQIV